MKAVSLLRCTLLGTALLTFSFCSEELVVESPDKVSDEKPEVPLTKATGDFFFGVAGHATGTPPYTNTPPTEQIDILKRLGMNVYRFSVLTTSDGESTVPYLFDPFVKAARDRGVTLLPMLHHRTLDFSVSNSRSYELGKALGRNFASQYKDIFTYYELGNELDNKCIIPGKAGKSRYSYDREKFKTIAAYLKGMNDGVKSADPDAKTMINAGWLHYGYLLMLEDHGVDFDIIAYHWYSEMEGAAKKHPYYIDDISERLSNRFNKPIWFTEVNIRNKDVDDIESRQHEFLSGFLAKIKRNPQVKAMIVYELFDEPHKSSFLESNYGLIKWNSQYDSWSFKKAARIMAENN